MSDDFALLRGDCIAGMAALPDASVDVCITDPPYGQHVHERQRSGTMNRAEGGPEMPLRRLRGGDISRERPIEFAHLAAEVRLDACVQFARLVHRWVLIFADLEGIHGWKTDLESCGLEYVRTCIWHKEGSTPQFTGDRPGTGCEAIVVAHLPGKKRWNGGGHHGFYECPIVLNRSSNGEQRVHPTQKPLTLMEALVRDFSEPGELVLDAFAGSATTGVACRRLGRRFVGFEQDENWYAEGRKRLEAAREQLTMEV